MNCKDCKWWVSRIDDPHSEGFGLCKKILGVSSNDAHVIARAFSCGCCGGAEFETRANFGCVQFEAK